MRRVPLTSIKLNAERSTAVYQTVIVDLAKTGLIDKAKAENLLGYKIKDYWEDSKFSKEINKANKASKPEVPSAGA